MSLIASDIFLAFKKIISLVAFATDASLQGLCSHTVPNVFHRDFREIIEMMYDFVHFNMVNTVHGPPMYKLLASILLAFRIFTCLTVCLVNFFHTPFCLLSSASHL